jgi:predicted XRE-type DNA-binding protein
MDARGQREVEVSTMADDNIHLRDPDAISWEDLRAEFAFSEEEEQDIARRGKQLMAQIRAYRLAELRKRKHVTQVEVAQDMGVTQARVSKIERGEVSRSEVDTLAAYVKALGGKLQLIANFGDESYVIG